MWKGIDKMIDVDRQTDEVIEMISQGARLTTNLINYVFTSLADRLEKNGENEFIKSQSKEGQQKINNLLRKHKDGIKSLDDNLTKEQVKDYQKELKKLGVDFSIVKNGKDNYSFFFAGGQAEMIEKALKNVVELKSRVMNNEKVKDAQLNLDSEMNNLTDEEKENVMNAYAKYVSDSEQGKDNLNLNDKEKSVFKKMEILDETKAEIEKEIKYTEIDPPTKKQLELAEKLGVENYQDMNKKEISLALEKAGAEPSFFNNKEASKEILHDRLSKLSKSELELFEKRIEYENIATSPALDSNKSQELATELKEMQRNHSKEVVNKINNIDKDIREFDNHEGVSKGSKLNANEILKETKKHSSERNKEKVNEKEKTYSVENLKKIDTKIKEESKNKDKMKQKEHSL